MPRNKMNFDLDQEEREIIAKADELSREQIWDLLERKRFDELKKRAIVLSGNMLSQARCPKCTLMPPCKHYTSSEGILKDATDIMNDPEYKKVITPHKRENLIFMLKKQTQLQRRNNGET